MDGAGHRSSRSAGTGPLAKVRRPHPWTSQVFPEWKQSSNPMCSAGPKRQAGHPGPEERWGILAGSRGGAGRGCREASRHFSTLLSHTGTLETRRQVAGVEEVGGGPAPVSITAGAGGEGPAASRGSWEEAGGGGVQLQLRPIHFLPPPLRPFQGRGPPKTSFSGRSGGAPPIGTGDWPPHSQQIPRQPTARLTPPTPSPGAAPPSYPHVQPQARQAAGGPQMPISSPRSSVFLVPVLHLQMSN